MDCAELAFARITFRVLGRYVVGAIMFYVVDVRVWRLRADARKKVRSCKHVRSCSWFGLALSRPLNTDNADKNEHWCRTYVLAQLECTATLHIYCLHHSCS